MLLENALIQLFLTNNLSSFSAIGSKDLLLVQSMGDTSESQVKYSHI